jgi:hypothetical protein
MQVGEHLVAVENGNFWPSSNSPRFPKRLIVEARVVWLTSSAVHVRLPEVDVVLDQKRIRLPAMAQKLNRRVRQHRGPANHRSDESSEWLHQPFYPQVRGNWCTANLADYYPPDIWFAFDQKVVSAGMQGPVDNERQRLERLLGVNADASRHEVIASLPVRKCASSSSPRSSLTTT